MRRFPCTHNPVPPRPCTCLPASTLFEHFVRLHSFQLGRQPNITSTFVLPSADHSSFDNSQNWVLEKDTSSMPIYPTAQECCNWCRSSWDCVYWERRGFKGVSSGVHIDWVLIEK